MLIRVGYEIIFTVPSPVAMTFLLYVHPSREDDLRAANRVQVEPNVPIDEFTDWFGNRCGRILAPAGQLRLSADNTVKDSGRADRINPDAQQVPVEQLPPEVLRYLFASRYCEVDRMSDIAWNLFGRIAPGWPRVQAVCDWVHSNVTFGYAFAHPTKSAFDVYTERKGVCRDFMHLAVTLCRALNIPARYCSGYLGDIGVPVAPFPMDFSAWFEVYLGGEWYTLDARHNVPRIGRILMSQGRDAVDIALTTSFGPTKLEKFTVWTDEVTAETALSS